MKVFLGGTCGDSQWRELIIPLLKMEYFNPVVSNWDTTAKQNELDARKECDVIVYTITPHMHGVYSIAELVEDSIRSPKHIIFTIVSSDGDKSFTPHQMASLDAVAKMVESYGAVVIRGLYELTKYLNGVVE